MNMVSVKKRDTILPLTNATLDPDEVSAPRPATFLPGRPAPPGAPAYTYVVPWIPTCRQVASGNGPDAQSAKLTSGTPYYVGLSEHITISTTGAAPWQWRRICFTLKGPELVNSFRIPNVDSEEVLYQPEGFYRQLYDNGVGAFRPLYDLASYYGVGPDQTSRPVALSALYSVLFQGTSNQFSDNSTQSDYINVIDAKTDKTRVTIKYDKTITIASGNDEGTQRQYKRYHPMKRTLVYENQEVGGNIVYSNYSTSGKPGMGDYYVIDMFQCRYLADGDAGALVFDPRSTLYWHER